MSGTLNALRKLYNDDFSDVRDAAIQLANEKGDCEVIKFFATLSSAGIPNNSKEVVVAWTKYYSDIENGKDAEKPSITLNWESEPQNIVSFNTRGRPRVKDVGVLISDISSDQAREIVNSIEVEEKEDNMFVVNVPGKWSDFVRSLGIKLDGRAAKEIVKMLIGKAFSVSYSTVMVEKNES